MNIFQMLDNSNIDNEIIRIQNVIGLYSLLKDICKINDYEFELSNDIEMQQFFNKYKDIDSISEININDFPIEKLLLFAIPFYEKIKSGKHILNPNDIIIPFDTENREKDEDWLFYIEKTIKKSFETELKRLKIIKNEKLKNYRDEKIINDLNLLLNTYIQKEQYEKAAVIRDEIKQFEKLKTV